MIYTPTEIVWRVLWKLAETFGPPVLVALIVFGFWHFIAEKMRGGRR